MITDKKIEQLKNRKIAPVIHEEFLAVIERLEFERDRANEAERLRDAYKKAKSENDDRFMGERDEARDQLRIERECRLANVAELKRADGIIGGLRASALSGHLYDGPDCIFCGNFGPEGGSEEPCVPRENLPALILKLVEERYEAKAEVERLRAQLEGRGPTGLRGDPS